jgi:uncharacterized protein (DUF927 family)
MRTMPEQHVTCTERAGWHGRNYVLPHATFGPDAGNLVFQATAPVDHRYARRGTLEDWRAGVGTLAIGNDYLIFAMSVAFASPLLAPLGEESGIFNFQGGSSVGKTTAARAACSVCGSGDDDGFKQSWLITGSALESLAYARCDGLIVLDEMSLANPQHIGAIAYMYANGQGKARANSHGNAKMVRRWRGLAFSTGELGIADLVREVQGDATAGQLVRVNDIPADDAGKGMGLFEDLHGEASPEAFARRVAAESGRAYGEADIAYLKAVAENYDACMTACRTWIEAFVAEAFEQGDGKQVRRVARHFAVVAAGGELAASLGIVPWPKQAAYRAALRLYRRWKQHRGGSTNAEQMLYLERLRDYIARNTGNFAKSYQHEPRPCAGYVKDQDGQLFWLVHPVTWKEIYSGRDARAAARKLAEMGVLWPTGAGNYQRTMRVPGAKSRQHSFYVVRDEALAASA